MMQFTITRDSDNAITKTVSAGALSLAESQVLTGHTLHSGHYPPDRYDYDGTDFTLKAEQPVQPFIFKSTREMLVDIYNQLSVQGFEIPAHVDGIESKAQANVLIDQAAGRARFRLVSSGTLIDQEYIIAEQQIAEWRLDGSNASELPECLSQAWLTASNQTAEQAATDLETMAQAWKLTLMQIRALRLTGKAAVNAATNEYKAVALGYIEQLDAIVVS